MDWLAVAVLMAYAGLLYSIARSDAAFKDTLAVNVVLAAVHVLLLFTAIGALVARNGLPGLLLGLPVAILATGIAMPYWLHIVRLLLDAGGRGISGTESMRVEPSFDLADKALRERRFDDAIRLYLEAAAASPSEPEPLRRAGEAEILAGRVEAGVARLRAALALIPPSEDHASLAFRISELLDRKLGRRDEARRQLEEAAARLAGTRFEEFARERLKAIP